MKKYTLSLTQEIPLFDTGRITYTFKYIKNKNKQINIIEVVNVSYEIYTNNEWITIIRFDSAHGYLHKHIRFSLTNPDEAVTTQEVITDGDHSTWLTWAISDIRSKAEHYKEEFLKRSMV